MHLDQAIVSIKQRMRNVPHNMTFSRLHMSYCCLRMTIVPLSNWFLIMIALKCKKRSSLYISCHRSCI